MFGAAIMVSNILASAVRRGFTAGRRLLCGVAARVKNSPVWEVSGQLARGAHGKGGLLPDTGHPVDRAKPGHRPDATAPSSAAP